VIQNFRQRLFKHFILLSVSLGIPLLACLVVLGSMVPRAHIETISLATAAQIAERLSTNVALNRISLNPNFSIEGHRLQTQPVFFPVASKTREALVKRTGSTFSRYLLEKYIATDIQLVMIPASFDGIENQQMAIVIAALDATQLGKQFDYSVYEDEDIGANLQDARIANQGSRGSGRWSAFAPVFNNKQQTVAMVVVHSDASMINKLDWAGAFFAFMLVGSVISLSVYFASRMARRIHHPIKALHEGMQEMAKGNFDIKLAPSYTGDEFDDLIRHFNNTSAQLKDRMNMLNSMQMAAEIQAKLLPQEYPDLPNYALAASLNYAELAGGDYYDFIHIPADKGINNRWLLVVGDVTGHGVSAALLVAWLRATVRLLARECKEDLVRLVDRLNASMLQDMNTGKFVTLFFAIVDDDSKRFSWLSAGHDPVRLYRTKSGEIELLEANGPPVGVVPSAVWEEMNCCEMLPNDTLLILTDGLQDAKDIEGLRLGVAAVDKCMLANLHNTPEAMQQSLLELMNFHRRGRELADDVTLLIVKCKG
jgi:serine phosphatase RsbU (regulator of sigma subunit)